MNPDLLPPFCLEKKLLYPEMYYKNFTPKMAHKIL